MADASPNSAKDLEIVEEVKDEDEDLVGLGDSTFLLQLPTDESQEEEEEQNGRLADLVEPEAPSSPSASGPNHCDKSDLDAVDTSSTSEDAIRSRVFVGHLDTERCTRSQMTSLFSRCGRVKAVSMHRGYGFVQYHTKQGAQRALEELHGERLYGMNLGTL